MASMDNKMDLDVPTLERAESEYMVRPMLGRAEMEWDEPPPPLPVARTEAAWPDIAPRIIISREQEIRYIEENGLMAFCQGAIVSAILQDIDYMRAQVVFLGKQ